MPYQQVHTLYTLLGTVRCISLLRQPIGPPVQIIITSAFAVKPLHSRQMFRWYLCPPAVRLQGGNAATRGHGERYVEIHIMRGS